MTFQAYSYLERVLGYPNFELSRYCISLVSDLSVLSQMCLWLFTLEKNDNFFFEKMALNFVSYILDMAS